ncbi:MAG: SUMF1/EgtB/PvdO family nonheme iron enzyme [Rikenellaceae bacterium]
MRLTTKLIVCFMLMSVISLNAKSKATSWQEAIIELKSQIASGKIEVKAPFYSDIKRYGDATEQVTYDVTGINELIIDIDPTSDGTSWDHGTLCNPMLTDVKGNKISLLDLTPLSSYSEHSYVRFNENLYGDKIEVNGKTYEKGIMGHTRAQVVYQLDGKYTQLDTEIGIERMGRNVSSVIFIFRDGEVDGEHLIKKYAPEFSKEIIDFLYRSKLSVLNTTIDGFLFNATSKSIERDIIEEVLSLENTPNKELFKSKLAECDELSGDKKLVAYVELANEIITINELNTKFACINPAAIALYLDDMRSNPEFDYAKYRAKYDELCAQLSEVKAALSTGDISYAQRGQELLSMRDEIILSNPLLENDILVSKFKLGADSRKVMAPHLGTQSNNWSNQESAKRTGFNSEIAVLSNLRGEVETRTVYAPEGDSPVSDLRLHWDGDRAMFTSIQEDGRWTVFEADIENGGAKKLVEIPEPDIELYDGTYLPDGRVIVTSNIGYQGVPCVNGSDPVGNMILYDPSDNSYRRLTFDQDANWNPSITNDGKVIYTRWEYTDLTHYYSRIVMTMNPDGTEQRALYGSGYMFPNSVFDMQVLPESSSAFVGVISGHHGVARSGRLILFDPRKSRKGAAGMLQEIPYRDREIVEEVKDRLVDNVWPQFIKPSPLNDKYFLVAAKLSPESLWGVYLVDVFDNVTCLYEAEGEGYISPVAIRKTVTPPSIPDKVDLDDKESTIFIQDIYEGEGLPGVPRGEVKELRIFAYEYAYLETKSDHNWQGIQSGWDIKRLLGTVPVEADGSAIFKIPANTPIAIQPVGKDGAAIQWMRSWFTAMPGEVVSCIGCHEDLNQVVIPKRVIASNMQPRKLTPPAGGTRSFTFDLEIQPILDRACVACHNGSKAFDLSDNSKDEGYNNYGKSYLNFHPYIHRQGGEGNQTVLKPYEYHPNTSELVRVLKKGHHNVELTDKEWRTLYNWIDFNAPDKGYFNAETPKKVPVKGQNQIERRIYLANKYGLGAGVDWQKELADYKAYLEAQGEITAVMPEPVKPVKVKEAKAKGWPFDGAELQGGREYKSVELGNGVTMRFVRIPAGEFVMGSNNGCNDAKPASKVKIGEDFWMAEIEVTNEQFNVFYPEHSSLYMDEQWKDHVDPGYPAFLPEQPVVRVSWESAMAFCEELSRKSGLKITLPTEAQWEWACRAGSAEDMWYGDLNADFGKKENMADKTTNLFAVSGIDPKPMNPASAAYKYYTFLPKIESVDDGNLIQVEGAGYDANPFGLYDMHGNVAEWTRSDYTPYPYNPKSKSSSEYKVVRGGSAYDRPKVASSHYRKAYFPHQQIFNVGFRVIIEE